MTRIAVICLVAALLAPVSASAAPPPNDDIANATELAGLPTEGTGSLVEATHEPGEPNHLGRGGSHSIWFKWTAPRSAGVTVVFGGCAPPYDPSASRGAAEVAVYAGAAAKFEELSPVQQRDGGYFRFDGGEVYWIAVDAPAGFEPATTTCFRLLAGPPNDELADAISLQGFPVAATQPLWNNEAVATTEPGEPYHDGSPPGGSVWYTWRAPASGRVIVRLCAASGSFTALAVYRGDDIHSLTHVGTRRTRDPGVCQAHVPVNAIEGQVYAIAVAAAHPPLPSAFHVVVGSQVAMLEPYSGSRTLLYTAWPGDSDAVSMRTEGKGARRAVLVDAAGVSAGLGCEPAAPGGSLRCPVVSGPLVFEVDLGDGSDRANIQFPRGSLTLRLGHGDDAAVLGTRHGHINLYGGPGADDIRQLILDAGSVLLRGGPGSDRLRGAGGDERLSGGPGADTLAGGPGGDSIAGGAGADEIHPGAGDDEVNAGPGNDVVYAVDRRVDEIDCEEGRDRVRIDGVDLSDECERRTLGSPARAVATNAYLDNEGLTLFLSCPIDATQGCDTQVTTRLGPRHRISRRLRLAPGASRNLTMHRVSENEGDRISGRGVRVRVVTHRPGLRALRFTTTLPVVDDRYYGE